MELEIQSMMSREAGLATTIYLYLLCLVGGFAKGLYYYHHARGYRSSLCCATSASNRLVRESRGALSAHVMHEEAFLCLVVVTTEGKNQSWLGM